MYRHSVMYMYHLQLIYIQCTCRGCCKLTINFQHNATILVVFLSLDCFRIDRVTWIGCCSIITTSDRSHDNVETTETRKICPFGKSTQQVVLWSQRGQYHYKPLRHLKCVSNKDTCWFKALMYKTNKNAF